MNKILQPYYLELFIRNLSLRPTTPPPLANDASASDLRRLRLRSPVDETDEVSYSGLQLLLPPSFMLFTGLRLYIGNFPLHMDEVLVKTTKSRRIRMVERKTRKRSVGKPKTKHLEARNTMERPEKKKRSVTLIRDHSKEYLSNLTVEFDHFGRAIGPNRFKFTGYRGVTTRKMISILIDSWDLVDQCAKDQLWLNIKNYWHIRDDDHKAQVLRDCNIHWKAYKSELLKLWDNGVNLVKKYPYLDKAMWKNFLVLKSTEEFENIWKDKKLFSSEELEERVKTWMRTFGDKVKPFCKAYNESTTKGKERLEVTKGKESWNGDPCVPQHPWTGIGCLIRLEWNWIGIVCLIRLWNAIGVELSV